MEFPKVKASTEKRLAELEIQIEKTREKLERALDILNDHELTIANKQHDYECYIKLQTTDPVAAKAFYEKKKLGVSLDRKRKKEAEVEDLEQRLEDLGELQMQLRVELKLVLNFTPIQDQFNEVKGEFRKATNEDWKKTPNSTWKTFQDVFAPPGYRTVPRSVGIFDGIDFDNIPLDSCVIDPDPKRSAARFAKEFDLADTSDAITPFKKIKTILDAKPEITNTFSHLKPMSPYGPDKETDSYRLLVFRDYKPEHDGKIVAPIFLGRMSPIQDRKVIQVFDSIYSAQRKALYANRSYETERPKLYGLQTRLKVLNHQTVGLRQDDPKVPAICAQLNEEVEILENATNHFKVEAGDILKAIGDIKDTLSRHNAGKACAQMVAVLNRLDKRMPQIHEKSKAMGDDEKTLSMRIDRAEAILDLCFNEFEAICKNTEQFEKRNGDGPLFQGHEQLKSNVDSALINLQNLDSLTIRPFNLYAAKLQEKSESIQKALEEGDVDTLRDVSIKAFVISKIFKVQQERERILKEITLMPDETSIDVLLEKAEELLSVVADRQVYPLVITSYEKIYMDIQNSVDTLVKGLRMHKNKNLNIEERRQMYKRLKKYLEEIDFPTILEQLD
jgi:hypothetical protein